jgi:hypothetical protein
VAPQYEAVIKMQQLLTSASPKGTTPTFLLLHIYIYGEREREREREREKLIKICIKIVA